MEIILYDRIKDLCQQKGITISKLESELGFGSSSIKKWGNTNSPSIDKVRKVAKYFGVSVDYLLNNTDIKEPIDKAFNNEDIRSIQKAREKLSPEEQQKMMALLKLTFDNAFSEE